MTVVSQEKKIYINPRFTGTTFVYVHGFEIEHVLTNMLDEIVFQNLEFSLERFKETYTQILMKD